MKESKKSSIGKAAAKADMDPKTARKYLKANALPSELKQPRKTSKNSGLFDEHWNEIESFLENSPGLEARTLLHWLINLHPEQYKHSQLRTLQRYVKHWRRYRGLAKTHLQQLASAASHEF